jgi:K+-sensing histidine kinase KdpD
VIFPDVNTLKKALADLERSNDELGRTQRLTEELNAFVVHDLKNPGVPEELKERIFDKYARRERDLGRCAADSRRLGLRLCRVMAEAHGGEIWLENVEPNGARFIVKLNSPYGDHHVVP